MRRWSSASASRRRSAIWLPRWATFPARSRRSIALADRIRTKGDPAAELILLPEGGELQESHIAPVLSAFDRIKKRRCIIDDCEAKFENPRLAAQDAKRTYEAQIAKERHAIGDELVDAADSSVAHRRHRRRAAEVRRGVPGARGAVREPSARDTVQGARSAGRHSRAPSSSAGLRACSRPRTSCARRNAS